MRIVYVNEDDYLLSECSCPYWLKNLICKHALVVCHAKKLFKIPILDVEIESNNKRGRKKGIPTAFTRTEYIKYNDQLFPREGLRLPIEHSATTSQSTTRQLTVGEIAANISSEEISTEEPAPKKKP